ncbi:MAG: LPS assembly lipoprotein LptE, partial [Planctomycetaceae bacterium]
MNANAAEVATLRRQPGSRLRFERTRRSRLSLLTALIVCCGVSGCSLFGYTTGGLDVPNVRTVHIPIFEMDGFRRDVKYTLTEAVQKEIKTRTRYRIADAAVADTILSGRILDVRKDVLCEEPAATARYALPMLGTQVIW